MVVVRIGPVTRASRGRSVPRYGRGVAVGRGVGRTVAAGRGVGDTMGFVPGAYSCGIPDGTTSGRGVAAGRGVAGRGVARGRGVGAAPPRFCDGARARSGAGAGAGTSGATPAFESPPSRIG